MNTTTLIEEVHKNLQTKLEPPLTREDVKYIVETVIGQLADGIENQQKITLRGFGTFTPTVRKARTYKVKGKEVDVPARRTVTFKPGKTLINKIRD